ncbi:uncharacterized protein [Physcomitrium patens]|nr:uncharacterized protein LOC112282303 isoform X2 [Physcomitrium patens]PNR53515.1 hypothetical protein PHYPA_007190 [Physcomitrium patens]|eukprot:XP_024375504.1 uncharacterized protein LOC112282303 isoform X2 [Physcomitrella patens]
MRLGVTHTGVSHSYLSAHGRFHHEIGTTSPSVVCLRVVNRDGESSRKGFGGGDENKKKAKKQGGGAGKQQYLGGGGVRREDNRRAVAVKEGSRQLQNVLRSVDKETAAQQQKKLGIDPDMAAKGKVDFVRVEAWGAEGTEAELENLKLKSFSPTYSSEDTAPFYEQLVRRLQLLESKGELAVVQAKPLPPFERWNFGEQRYMQFLQDQLAVYTALKDVIAAVKNSRTQGDTIASDSVDDIDNRTSLAIATFDSSLGLDRHEELAADIQALSEATSRIGMSLEVGAPTTQTTAYIKRLEQIGLSATSTENGPAEGCLRLLAHIFAIHVAHLTTGMRVGAKAVECLSLLKEARAVRFYRDYPKQAQDPLRVLIGALNTAGSYLVLPEEREQVMQELPKAIQRTSLLLSVLAVEEQQ